VVTLIRKSSYRRLPTHWQDPLRIAVGEFEGDVGVRVRRHATWNMERHLVTRRDPGMET
jgi:hypothetical protein